MFSRPVLIIRILYLIFPYVLLSEQIFWVKIPGRETPGSIPNPAVKPSRADGSMWATACESRYRPDVIREESLFDSPFCFGNRGRGLEVRNSKEQENWSTVDGPPSSQKSIFTPKGYWR